MSDYRSWDEYADWPPNPMTTPEALTALADRVEREEPSRELDGAIGYAIDATPKAKNVYKRGHYIGGKPVLLRVEVVWPPYTTSLDSAVTLVPPEYANAWSAGDNSGEHQIFGRLGYEHEATGLTPAAALTAASLRARAADMQARSAPHPSPEQKGFEQ